MGFEKRERGEKVDGGWKERVSESEQDERKRLRDDRMGKKKRGKASSARSCERQPRVADATRRYCRPVIECNKVADHSGDNRQAEEDRPARFNSLPHATTPIIKKKKTTTNTQIGVEHKQLAIAIGEPRATQRSGK